ncbi:MAG: HD domain-containing protein [Chitinophagales bacterium]|nr:HD domain-containing protein [Chitinophagales bacterium]
MNYRGAKQYILDRMSRELSGHLAYHGLHHTLDVLAMSVELCESEGVGAHDTVLVKTAALYHDCGFVKDKHAGHELEGCRIVQDQLPLYGYSDTDIETICGMIMATKIPQSPKSLLEEIICDADLDYLGRPDFFKIGETLFHELHAYHLIDNEQAWNRLQVSFLSAHRFHTQTNIRRREPAKQEYLLALKGLVATYEV